MIFQLLQNDLPLPEKIISLFFMPLVILVSLTLHECAHGYVSFLQGDPTAKRAGRLTFNPFKHMDVLGTVFMIICGFGWAKAVPIDPRYYKKPKKGMALTALAGPAINALIGITMLIQFSALVWLKETGAYQYFPIICNLSDRVFRMLSTCCYIVMYYNILLAVFNLFPVPPLDGSRILFAVLPDKYYFGVMRYERIIMFVMLFLLWTGIFTTVFESVVDMIITGVGNLVFFVLNNLASFLI